MTNAEIIQFINRIQDGDKIEKAKAEGKKPKGETLKIIVAVAVTLIVIIGPSIVLGFLVESPSKSTVRIFAFGLIAVLMATLLFWRQSRISRFMSVKDARSLIDLVEVSDQGLMDTIVEKDALVFTDELDNRAYNLIYNWLKHREMLRGERLNIYNFTGKQLREAVPEEIEVLDYMVFYAIRLDEIAFEDNAQGRLFSHEHFYVAHGRWLSDIINGAKKIR